MAGSHLVPGESDFAVLPSTDHTYALDNFPTDEVPKVFAFEEVQSQTQMPQSFFSIVEEHAYAYRDQNMLADEWSNLPGINAEPHGVDVGTQTEAPASKETDKEEYFKALAAVEKSVRSVSLTVSRSLISSLEAAAAFLSLSLTVKGSRVRCARVSDLLRLLMIAPNFPQAAPDARPKARPPPGPATPEPASEPARDASVLRSGRVASRFNVSALVKEGEVEEEEKEERRGQEKKEGFVCPTCGVRMSSQGSLTRHLKTVHVQDGRLFACRHCPARYKRKDTLLEHMATKHRAREDGRRRAAEKYLFRCRHCFRAFKRKTTLEDHMNTHTGTLAHDCRICDQKFTSRSVLCYHVKSRHGLTLSSLQDG